MTTKKKTTKKPKPKALNLEYVADCREFISQVRLPDGSPIDAVQFTDDLRVPLEKLSDAAILQLANDLAQAAQKGNTIQ